MKNLISTNGYTFDSNLKIWSRLEYQGIPYSDGDEVENRIGSIIKSAKDVSVMSDELRDQCVDWPTHYYLNKNRVNLLRHFSEQLKNLDVLEIGAGCGAITRFFGECQANVFALEGSKRRASIARERCRDLNNVEVVSENFTEFKLNHQFDVITLIGVLEYANWFTPGANPALEMLKKVRGFLKPNGVLIIAIENQLGLKYYAGAPEDHLSERMIGVEGRYQENGPQTFGKQVLESMLRQAGFNATDFSAPVPDYKLPVAVITKAGFENSEFKAKDLAFQSVVKDRQLQSPYAFSQERAWGPLFDNKIALDLSNSFLITASISSEHLVSFNQSNQNTLAYYYSSNRMAQYCKETTFKTNLNGEIAVEYRRENFISPEIKNKPNHATVYLSFSPKTKARYFGSEYQSFSQLIHHTVKTHNWSCKDLSLVIQQYLQALEKLSLVSIFGASLDKNARLPNSYFDAITHNVMINKNTSEVFLIDEEWVSSFEPKVGYLIFRSIIAVFSELTVIANGAGEECDNFKSILEAVFRSLGTELTEEDINEYEALEVIIQSQVSGVKNFPKGFWYHENQLNFLNALDYQVKTASQQGEIDLLNKGLKELSEELIYLRTVKHQFESLLENNEAIFTSQAKNTELNYHERLLRIYNSKLWHLARKARALITKLTGK